jgi:hypothetical protein
MWDEVIAAVDVGDTTALQFEPDAVLARVDELGDAYSGSLAEDQELPELS